MMYAIYSQMVQKKNMYVCIESTKDKKDKRIKLVEHSVTNR